MENHSSLWVWAACLLAELPCPKLPAKKLPASVLFLCRKIRPGLSQQVTDLLDSEYMECLLLHVTNRRVGLSRFSSRTVFIMLSVLEPLSTNRGTAWILLPSRSNVFPHHPASWKVFSLGRFGN